MYRFQDIRSYLKGFRLHLIAYAFLNVLSIVFSLFSFLMIVPFLQVLFDQTEEVSAKPGPIKLLPVLELKESLMAWANYRLHELTSTKGEMQTLAVICITIVLLFLFKNLFRYMSLYVAAPMKKGVLRKFRHDYYRKLLYLPMKFFHKEKRGDLLTRFANDIQAVEFGIVQFLDALIREPIYILATFALLLFMNVKLTLMVLAILPISAYIIARIGKRLKAISSEVQSNQSEMVGMVEETIHGAKAIKSFRAQPSFLGKFEELNEIQFQKSVGMNRRRDLSSPLSEFLGMTVIALILWMGGRSVLQSDTIEPEIFIAFIVIFSQVISPSKALANAWYFVQRALASVQRIQEVLEYPEEEGATSVSGIRLNGEIEFKDISFGYDDLPVLKDLNLRVAAGEKVALVGRSGGGKSTILEIIAGFHSPQKGRVLYDGMDRGDFSLTDLRSNIGIVTQDTILFNDTVGNNISLGDEQADLEKITRAAQKAYADIFIQNLPLGYDQPLGNHGEQLSGGERQRLALARAFYKNAPILLMDEPTSSLDSASEQHIQQALFSLWKDKTVLIIAHRLSTIQHADRILVIDQGKIIQEGSYEELFQQEGVFRELVVLQQL